MRTKGGKRMAIEEQCDDEDVRPYIEQLMKAKTALKPKHMMATPMSQIIGLTRRFNFNIVGSIS